MGVLLVRLLLIADIELLVRVCSMQHSMQQYAAVCTIGFRKLESLASSAHDHADLGPQLCQCVLWRSGEAHTLSG